MAERALSHQFLVSPSGWNELARLPLRVLSERGFEQTRFAPGLDVQGSSVLDEHVQPLGGAATADDGATLNARVEGGYLRNGWRFDGRAHAIGVSKQENALRFGVDGARAPQFDLADYSLRFQRADNARGFIELGHVSQTMHRHLMPSFSSRGSRFGVPLGRSGAATFSTMNGTSIAGWRNFIGLRDREHRIATAGFGFELAPARPGSVRLDIDYLDGSVLPQTGFNAGNIADAKTSQAWGLGIRRRDLSRPARPSRGSATHLRLLDRGHVRPQRSGEHAGRFWHNWICTECHTAPRTGLSASPEERALLASWARFKPVHDRFAPVAKSRRSGELKPENQISTEARRLLAEMRGGTLGTSTSPTPRAGERTIPPAIR